MRDREHEEKNKPSTNRVAVKRKQDDPECKPVYDPLFRSEEEGVRAANTEGGPHFTDTTLGR